MALSPPDYAYAPGVDVTQVVNPPHFPGMAHPRTAWVRLYRLRTGVGCFLSCLYK